MYQIYALDPLLVPTSSDIRCELQIALIIAKAVQLTSSLRKSTKGGVVVVFLRC